MDVSIGFEKVLDNPIIAMCGYRIVNTLRFRKRQYGKNKKWFDSNFAKLSRAQKLELENVLRARLEQVGRKSDRYAPVEILRLNLMSAIPLDIQQVIYGPISQSEVDSFKLGCKAAWSICKVYFSKNISVSVGKSRRGGASLPPVSK